MALSLKTQKVNIRALQTTRALEIGESVVKTEVIHPCALVNAGIHANVRGWTEDACARMSSGDGPVTAGFEQTGLASLLIFFIAQL